VMFCIVASSLSCSDLMRLASSLRRLVCSCSRRSMDCFCCFSRVSSSCSYCRFLPCTHTRTRTHTHTARHTHPLAKQLVQPLCMYCMMTCKLYNSLLHQFNHQSIPMLKLQILTSTVNS